MATRLALDGLNALDAEELKEALGNESVQLTQPEAPEGNLAEPTTISALITLSPLVAGLVAAWISKPRRRKIARRKTRIIRADGTIEEKEWEINDLKEDAIKSQVFAQLTKWLRAQ